MHVIAGLDAVHGGPSYSVPQNCQGLGRIGANVQLFSVNGNDATLADRSEARFHERRFPCDYTKAPLLRSLRFSAALARTLRETAPLADIVHNHGIWLMPNLEAGWAARRVRKPFIVSPRGMLAPAALAFSRLRKRAFWALVQSSSIRGAACLHATSEQEYEEIRGFGLRNPIAVIANGIDVPRSPGRENIAKLAGDRVVLSLGRLHPKKGLDRLLHAWAKVESSHPGWRLRIVGPPHAAHDDELRSPQGFALSCVSVEGPLYGDAKAEAYRGADLFVLPTLNENFGQTVAEALVAEIRTISTKGAPWSGLEAEGCGWWIDHGVGPLAATLASAMELPDDRRAAMGAKGRVWMAQDFSWQRVAREMLAVYRWLARDAKPASTIRFDSTKAGDAILLDQITTRSLR